MTIRVDKRRIILALLVILAAQLVVFYPSFKLSLFGDDWLAFWRHWWLLVLDKNSYGTGFIGHLTYLLTPYGPQDILMGFLSTIFNYKPLPYFIISFLFRYLLSASIFYVIYRLSKNFWASFAGGLFYSVTVVGLDTTNWVFNMTSYLGLIFFMYFILFYFESFKRTNWYKLFISYLFLITAMVIVPIRTHGVIPLVLLTEAFYFLSNRKDKQINRNSLIRIVLFLVTIYTIGNIGTSFGNLQGSIERIVSGIEWVRNAVSVNGTYEVFLYLIIQFGNMIFPETLWDGVKQALSFSVIGRPRPFPVMSLLIFMQYTFLITLFVKDYIKGKSKIKFTFMILTGVLWNIIVWIFYKKSPITFSPVQFFGAALIGGYFIILIFNLVFLKIVEKKHRITTFAFTVWPILFIVLPWISNPWSLFESSHRYNVSSGVGMALILAYLLVSAVNKKVIALLFLVLTFVQAGATYKYLNKLVIQRGIVTAEKVWDPIETQLPHLKDGDGYYVVYFEGDTTNGEVIHNNAYFGFPPRMGLRDQLTDRNTMPFAITSYKELVMMTKDGTALEAHGKKERFIAIDNVFAFRITGKTPETVVVENITESIRTKLLMDGDI